MKTQSALIAGGIAIVLVIAMLIWLATRSAAPSAEQTDTTNEPATSQTQNQDQAQDQVEAETASVSITSSGFEPANLTVAPGTTVTWTNNNGITHMVASDPHPTHGENPGFESDEIAPGGTYSFTFNTVKTHNYHDHLNPSYFGSVTVSE